MKSVWLFLLSFNNHINREFFFMMTFFKVFDLKKLKIFFLIFLYVNIKNKNILF
jgi:hypothetical protein